MSAKASKIKKTPRTPRRRVSFRRRQQSTSIFFLLWTVFSLLALVVMLLFSFTQQVLFTHSYKDSAFQEISQKGAEVRRAIEHGPPESVGSNNYNGYISFLNRTYGIEILVLDEEGNLILPQDLNVRPSEPEYREEVTLLLKKLQKSENDYTVYEGEGAYVYGAPIRLHGSTRYLHVSKSLQLMQEAQSKMNTRTVLLAVFLFVLTFAVSSAVAGWLVNPITELTKKAKRLAEGDFNVDFHGNEYGRELVELADTLNFARDELSKTDAMQKELIANVSHDFKTPLTMIKGYASMIMEISGDNPEKRNKHAQIIVDEADRLTSLVSDVLDLSKIRSGISQLELTNMNVSEYLEKVLDRFAYLKDTQGYRFILDVDAGLITRADEVKIGQALYNLIGNAVNYTGEDKQVYISLKREGNAFRFAVRDTGKGIPQEELATIWERYYRSKEAHKRPVQGTGLGLSIVKTVLERHGFSFGVESEEGRGSTFYVIFPINT